MTKSKTECITCIKIICKSCGWEAMEEEVEKIVKKELTACPVCGWSPG